MSPRRYRRRPIEVEAVQWTGDNFEECVTFAAPYIFHRLSDFGTAARFGNTFVGRGAWLIRAGDWRDALDSSEFEAAYEPVGDTEGGAS